MTAERITLPVEGQATATVTAAVHRPGRATGPAVLLAPGAGGNLDGDGLVALAEVFARIGCPTVRTNLPHHEAGRGGAPRAERSVEAYRQILAAASRVVASARGWVAGGKSYGGRVASLAAADGLDVRGLVFYGYPLHPPGKPDRLRVDHWPALPVPCLFLQGSADTFADLRLLEANLRKLPRRATLHVVAGGDHSLRVTRAASPDGIARRPAATIAGLGDVLTRWLVSLEE